MRRARMRKLGTSLTAAGLLLASLVVLTDRVGSFRAHKPKTTPR